ncbi:MAG TPA: CBS domain-containing protein, partial [Bacillota bacterium]|nr:CBS domain-containing protein [Bacillota bacterium]
MKLREIMTPNVETVAPESTVYDAAKKMQAKDVGVIPVVQGGHPVGMVTDRDITLRVVAEGKDAKSCKCSDIMSTQMIFG